MENSFRVVIATKNPDKLREIKDVLDSDYFHLLSMNNFRDFPDVAETGSTLEENAFKKAREINVFTRCLSLADDTGLEVKALDGRPGVFSSRFAGEAASYSDNVKKLLFEMKNVPENNRDAQFRTVMALVDKDKIFSVEGIQKGKILYESRGNNGFGYDPVFYIPEYDQTFAEMSLELKNRISHRGKALLKMKDILLNYCQEVFHETK